MSASLAVLGLAVLGAALFLAAGYSLGRAVTPPPAPPTHVDEVPAAGLLAAVEESRLRAESLERARDELEAELVAERGVRKQQTQQLESSTTDLADARTAKDALQRQLETLEHTHAELVARLATRDRELTDAERKLAAKPAPGFSEMELKRTHEALERACEEIVALRLEKQRGERAELARLALERELQHLRATQVAASASSRPLRSVAVAEPNLTTTHLNALVDRVRVEGEYVAVAVADAQGLAAAGVGEHVDELAAFSALLMGLNGQANRYFPMHEFGHATLTDAQGVTVEARPVPGPHGLVLLTLGATQETR